MNQFLSILCLLIVPKPVRATILQWHQSQRFKPGKKPNKEPKGCKITRRIRTGDQEAVKECYKEYIGMVKIYYEGAQRSKQGRPGEDVVGNSSGTAWIKEPQAFAKMSVEIEDTLDGTPRKKSRIARDDVNKESNEKQKQLEGRIASVTAAILLLGAAALNSRQIGEVDSYGRSNCYIPHPRIFVALGSVFLAIKCDF
ncbi:hypothetical protein Tco_0523677 [Tanacetum coccineum]